MKFVFYLCLSICLVACNSTASDSFILEGSIKGLEDSETISLYYLSLQNDKWYEVADTTRIIDGKFSFEGKIDELTAADLCFGNIEIRIYLEPTKMNLTVDKDCPYAYQLSGTRVEKENIELRKELEKNEVFLFEKIEPVHNIIEQINLHNNDSSIRDSLMNILDKYRNELIANSEQIDKTRLDFVSRYNTYQIAPDLLYLAAKRSLVNIDTIKRIYNSLPEQSKMTLMGKLTDRKIEQIVNQEKRRIPMVGDIAPDFIREDLSNKIVQLSKFRNKNYVLLDFWASWCGPCLKGIPIMKKIHNQYSDKGLVIVGISCDDDKNNWLGAIDKNGLRQWSQILSTQTIDNSVFKEDDISDIYDAEFIPLYVLVDKQGTIVARWQHIGEEELTFIDNLIKN
ncbi:TlpA disulfide reductase family protein [Dysgonomonas sp. ZJ709]|uniref:TlpA disulfide reductase family protein n=1 Tax=Dysgonomonas sp. ZJ709 TaxID=2709797 RepID=UPI0013EE1EAB|nr:TlpA disulfide reductase family protein [Dysgonomonas sp. ZJ709]